MWTTEATFTGLFVCLVVSTICKASQDGCFRAAVYEHIRQGTVTNQTQSVLLNLNVYEEVTKIAAKNQADILVFPEDGLFFPVGSRSDVRPLLEEVPDPTTGKHNPCSEAEKYTRRPILRRLSCAATENKLYLAADLGEVQQCNQTLDQRCPDDGVYQFNTLVLFDADGNLLVKYRKMQLFGEMYYNVPPKPELVFVDTPFGRFGLFICFDMIFQTPGINLTQELGVQTMLYPTWWFDQLPFLTAAQYQQAWAFTNRVNLLAANIHLPRVFSYGSGIYSGRRGQVVYTNTPDDSARLLLANVPIDARSSKSCQADARVVVMDNLNLEKPRFEENHMKVGEPSMNMTSVNQVLLVKNSDQISLCTDQFCCQLNYSASAFEDQEKYYLIVSNRILVFAYSWCEEFCAVVKCLPDNSGDCVSFPTEAATVFHHISLSANFSTAFVYPNAIGSQSKLLPKSAWTFSVSKSDTQNDEFISTLALESDADPVLTFGLYGRCYQQDPPYKQTLIGTASRSSIAALSYTLIAVFLVIFYNI